MSAVAVKKVEYQGVKPWVTLPLEECADILDAKRVPINSTERNQRIEGKSSDQLFPYYGATGEVGFIDDYIFDGDYLLIGEDAAPFFDKSKEVAFMVHGKFWVNNHAHILNAKPVTSNKYLKHYLNHFNYEGYVGGTTRLKLNQAQLKKIPVPIPSPEQQKQIVAKIEELFSHVDAGIAALKQSKQLLKQYRQSVLKAAVTGELSKEWREQNKDKLEPASKLLERILQERRQKWEAQQLEQFKAKGKVPKDEGWKGKYVEPIEKSEWNIDVIPDGWTQCHLDQLITELKNGISAKPTEESGLAIFRISAVRPLKVNLEDIRYLKSDFESSGYELENGDLLFTRYNGNAELVGVCGQVRNLQAKTVYPDKLMRVRLVSDKLTCTDYIELVCNTGRSRDYIQSKARTTAGQTGVSGGDVKKIPLPFPPYEEQVIISKEVESRISSIIEMEKSIDSELQRSDRLKQSVLQSAFGGGL